MSKTYDDVLKAHESLKEIDGDSLDTKAQGFLNTALKSAMALKSANKSDGEAKSKYLASTLRVAKQCVGQTKELKGEEVSVIADAFATFMVYAASQLSDK